MWDLDKAHVAALRKFDDILAGVDDSPAPFTRKNSAYRVVNLGTGRGTTVHELVCAFEAITGQRVPVKISPRRDGDVAGAFANADKALSLLNWRCELSLEEGIADALAWASCREGILGYL